MQPLRSPPQQLTFIVPVVQPEGTWLHLHQIQLFILDYRLSVAASRTALRAAWTSQTKKGSALLPPGVRGSQAFGLMNVRQGDDIVYILRTELFVGEGFLPSSSSGFSGTLNVVLLPGTHVPFAPHVNHHTWAGLGLVWPVPTDTCSVVAASSALTAPVGRDSWTTLWTALGEGSELQSVRIRLVYSRIHTEHLCQRPPLSTSCTAPVSL